MNPSSGGGTWWTSLVQGSPLCRIPPPLLCGELDISVVMASLRSWLSVFCCVADGTDLWCFRHARVFFCRVAPWCASFADRLKEGTFHSTVPTIGFNAVRWPPVFSSAAIWLSAGALRLFPVSWVAWVWHGPVAD